jgi:uncharacterized damage-inducible protein DinB
MSWIDQVRSAYAYNQWANDKVLDAAAQLSDEELTRKRPGSYGSLAADLAHIVSTQQGWLSFLAGEERPPRWEPPREDVIPTLRQHFDASHERLRTWTSRVSEADLDRRVTTTHDGKEYAWQAWQVLFHLANHGTQHRAEAGIVLLELGASPGDLDAIDFFDLLNAAAPS